MIKVINFVTSKTFKAAGFVNGRPIEYLALSHIVLFFSVSSAPVIPLLYKCINYFHRREYAKIIGIVLAVLLLVGCFSSFKSFKINQLRVAGSGTIHIAASATAPRQATTGIETVAQYLEFPQTVSPDQAIV